MKSNAYTSILLGVLAAIAIFSLVVCGWYINVISQARRLQAQLGAAPIRQAIVRQLIDETAEYGKRTNNKEVIQILESIGLRFAQNNSSTNSK